MQLSDIRTAVLYRAGLDTGPGPNPAAVLNGFINGALREISAMRDWNWLKTSGTFTTVTVPNVAVPDTDVRAVTRLYNTTQGYALEMVTPRYANKYRGMSGLPRFWYLEGSEFFLFPTPSNTTDTITYDYLKDETVLSADSDEPVLPERWIDLLIIKAAKKVAARVGDAGMHRLLADEERSFEQVMIDDARATKGPPILDSRRDWS